MANKALVVGASGFSKKYIKKIIADYDFVIACDKGAEAFYGTDMEFDLCIGDFDSLDKNVREYFKSKDTIKYPIEKDFSDLELAINYLIEKDFQRIDFTGVLGGRLSHELFNLGLFLKIKKEGRRVSIREAATRCDFLSNNEVLNIPKGLEVSVVPFYDDDTTISMKGFRWNLKDKKINRGSTLTLSNYTVDEGYIMVKGNPVMVVIEPIEKKIQ